jgi:hypothetical protein
MIPGAGGVLGTIYEMAIKIMATVIVDVAIAYASGTRDNSQLWKTAGVSALTAAAQFVGGMNTSSILNTVIKIAVVTALNYQAAKEQGLRGKQLLLAGALSLTSAIVSELPDKFKITSGKDPQQGDLDFSMIRNALVGALLAEVVARVIVNSIDQTSGQVIASLTVQLLADITMRGKEETSDSKKPRYNVVSKEQSKWKSVNFYKVGFDTTFNSSIQRLREEKTNKALLEQSRVSGAKSEQDMADLARAAQLSQVYFGSLQQSGSPLMGSPALS